MKRRVRLVYLPLFWPPQVMVSYLWPSRKVCPPRSAGATEHVKREFQARIGASARLRDEGPRCSSGTGAKRPVARGFAITVPSGWFAQQPQRTRLPSGAIFDPDTSGRLTQGSLLSSLK